MFQSLHAISAALRDFLQTLIDADPLFGAAANPWTNRAMYIQVQTPEEVTRDNGQGGLSLWLYRFARDEERLNDRSAYSRAHFNELSGAFDFIADSVRRNALQPDP